MTLEKNLDEILNKTEEISKKTIQLGDKLNSNESEFKSIIDNKVEKESTLKCNVHEFREILNRKTDFQKKISEHEK